MNIEKVIKERQGTIVDVRTAEEFLEGHVGNSINIPLHEIAERMEELKNLKTPLVLCCASGNRSEHAHLYLTQHGVNCCNGGSWVEVNYYQSQAV